METQLLIQFVTLFLNLVMASLLLYLIRLLNEATKSRLPLALATGNEAVSAHGSQYLEDRSNAKPPEQEAALAGDEDLSKKPAPAESSMESHSGNQEHSKYGSQENTTESEESTNAEQVISEQAEADLTLSSNSAKIANQAIDLGKNVGSLADKTEDSEPKNAESDQDHGQIKGDSDSANKNRASLEISNLAPESEQNKNTAVVAVNAQNDDPEKENEGQDEVAQENIQGLAPAEERLQRTDPDYEETQSQPFHQEAPTKLKSLIETYQREQAFLQEEGFSQDQATQAEAMSLYLLWKPYIMTLGNQLENVIFTFVQTIQKSQCGIVKKRRILSLGMDPKNPQKSLDNLKTAGEHLAKITPEILAKGLDRIKGLHQRQGGDSDYLLEDENIKPQLRMLLKQQLAALLIIYKRLGTFGPKELHKLMLWMVDHEHAILAPLAEPDYQQMLEALANDEKIFSAITDLEDMLRANYQRAQKASELVNSFQKHYFTFLDKTLLRALNELRESRKSFLTARKKIGDVAPEILNAWENLFTDLIKMTQQWLQENLHITALECKRGDVFNPDTHNPIIAGQPDEELESNEIKEIVNDGYVCEPELRDGDDNQIKNRRYLIRNADVIVVRNPEKRGQ